MLNFNKNMDFSGQSFNMIHPISKFSQICQVGVRLMRADRRRVRHETLGCFFLGDLRDLGWARGSAVGRGTALQVGRSRVRFPMVSLDFFSLTRSFRPHYGPGVDSASNRNEYQEYFLGVKAAGA